MGPYPGVVDGVLDEGLLARTTADGRGSTALQGTGAVNHRPIEKEVNSRACELFLRRMSTHWTDDGMDSRGVA